MSHTRENWSARSGFILAAIGSAIGLGNIWRFPYVAYENGGGAFVVPYLVALLTAGLPLLFLDYAVGHRSNGTPPKAYKALSRPAESLGWWQVAVCTFIGLYYASVLTWAGSYIFFSFGQAWGEDTKGFFFSSFLQTTEATGFEMSFISHLFWPLVAVWVLILIILYGGVKKGIELSNRIFLPLLVVLFVILVIRALTLDGAVVGLNAFFTPDWEKMADYKVWLAAFGHVFFSLSLGFGIMVTYASYLKPKTNLTGSGLIVGFANCSFEILAGIGVFAALGFMAVATNSSVQDVAGGGIGLAFIAFPKLVSTLGDGFIADAFGVLFFTSLFVAGVTSMVSILEVPIAAVQDKFKWSRSKAVTVIGGASAIVSIFLFSTTNAIKLVDIIDHFVNNIGIVTGALVSIILVSWFKRSVMNDLAQHINTVSSVKVGATWKFTLTFITPLVLGVTLILAVYNLIIKPYEGYSAGLLFTFGWGCIAICALSMLFSKFKDR
ncbi:MAG: sodium-dependent transporter [Acinetobacter sp.]|nr:sodium-dependent transporter [Acinetobacter sp.]